MAKALGVSLLPLFISVLLVTAALAASVDEFYKGKTIQFPANPPWSSKICLEPLC